MKKITLVTIMAVSLSSATALSANANDGAGFHTSHESGVKVFRGAPTQLNYQAAATFKSLELREQQIANQNLPLRIMKFSVRTAAVLVAEDLIPDADLVQEALEVVLIEALKVA